MLREGDNGKQHPPELMHATGYAIGPPPLFDAQMSEKAKPYLLSVTNDADYVPRVSPQGVGRLFNDVVEKSWAPCGLLNHLQVVKWVLALGGESEERGDWTKNTVPGSSIHVHRHGMGTLSSMTGY